MCRERSALRCFAPSLRLPWRIRAIEVRGILASIRHQHIMQPFEEWLEANGNRPAHLLEVCSDLGVPARTLTLCCQQHLGMSPIHYLWLRRMKLAKVALQQANASATVTAVALSLGFVQLGRFAVSYRSLFGESPSATLLGYPIDSGT
jgi:transcriptional regulator GlxA family with amidase domain